VPAIQVTPEIIGLIVLPPPAVRGRGDLSWPNLRRVWRPVTILAVGLVAVSASAVGLVASLTLGLPPGLAFLLGAVLASTDPVAVTALARRLSLPGRLHTLVQAESLFNDATSLILFRVATSFVVAGVAAGAAVAALVALVRRRTEDAVVETVVALLTPYAAYVAAERCTPPG
jgi:monovalent cation/hydrogen antiporter